MLKRVWMAAATAALLIGTSGAVAGVAGSVQVTITPIAVLEGGTYNTSYSEEGAPFYLNYEVTIKNRKATANDVRFTALIQTTDPEEVLGDLVTSIPCTQTIAPGSATLSCALGQMKAGDVRGPFLVSMTTPVKKSGGTGVGDAAGTDKLSFKTITYYAEGGQDDPTNLPNSTAKLDAPDIVLGTATSFNIRSALRLSDVPQTFATANNDSADLADQIKTAVKIPKVGAGTFTIDITESALAKNDRDCKTFSRCYQSGITIPGYTTTDGFVEIEFAVGKAAFKNNTNPLVAIVEYDGVRLNLCEPAVGGGYATLPCISEPLSLSGDGAFLLVKILNDRNGIGRSL